MIRVLLDTHAFLWMAQGYENLSDTAIKLIEDPQNQWFLNRQIHESVDKRWGR